MSLELCPEGRHATARVSWNAYITTNIVPLFMLVIGAFMAFSFVWFGTALCLIASLLIANNVLELRSIRVYTDDEGVWLSSGFLPWDKGVGGVKWRDLEDATYYRKFTSWALKSYTIRIGHRFTKTSEIILPNIRYGDLMVMHINQLHSEMVAESRLA